MVKRITFLTSLGAGLEYYDFIIYGMMAGQLSTLFFGGDEYWIGVLKAFSIFAVGYLARPIGGILFGVLGDIFGRKSVFLAVMMLMAISTMGIGLLPTYSQIGSVAALLLIILRLLQGLSYGAEMPGALTVVCEYANPKTHGFYFGWIFSSASVGSVLATLVLYLLTQAMEQSQILSWGWRLPFLFGGMLAIVNYFIRKNLQETPPFVELQQRRATMNLETAIWKTYWPKFLLGIGMTILPSTMVIFALFMPTYLTSYFPYDLMDVYLAMLWGMIWTVLMLPFCGILADRIGKGTLMIIVCGLVIFGAFALFGFLQEQKLWRLVVFMLLYQTLLSLLTVSFSPLLANLFPTQVRYTGIAACYNMAYSLMGMAPMAITALIEATGSASFGIWLLIFGASISLISTLIQRRKVYAAVS